VNIYIYIYILGDTGGQGGGGIAAPSRASQDTEIERPRKEIFGGKPLPPPCARATKGIVRSTHAGASASTDTEVGEPKKCLPSVMHRACEYSHIYIYIYIYIYVMRVCIRAPM
jgi:hypothetical protein